MTNWTKVAKFHGSGCKRERTTPAVVRNQTGSRTASVLFPASMAVGPRATFYTDGNGKLAIRTGESGDYAVAMASKASKLRRVTIPAVHSGRIPFGTTDARIDRDGDMLVIDLSQFDA